LEKSWLNNKGRYGRAKNADSSFLNSFIYPIVLKVQKGLQVNKKAVKKKRFKVISEMFFKGAFIETIFQSQSFLYPTSFFIARQNRFLDEHHINGNARPGNLTIPFLIPTSFGL
jgi:hypothetical protein